MIDNKRKIGLILPAYNESKVIGSVLDSLPASISVGGRKYKVQIVVVNDGSRDATASEVAKKEGVVLINHIINSGAGAATRTGLHYAKSIGCEYALTMDSDGQHSSKDMAKLAQAIIEGKSDFIIGSRLKSSDGNMPISKKIGNLGLGVITFILLGVYASDTQSGLKALNRKALESVEFHSNNYAFCSEMIWKAHQSKLRINEVPIEAIYTDYSVSRGQRNLTGAMEITKQLIKRRFLSFINE
jgi:glycosyltransferase involved in cell wall biosynthesis